MRSGLLARVCYGDCVKRQFWILLLCVSCCLALGTQFAQCNPFLPYLSKQPPRIVRDLGTTQLGDVQLHRVVFYSRTVQTASGPVDTDVYAVIASPRRTGRYPGMVLLHGGDGNAQEDLAISWASQGYVAIAADLPGIANSQKTPNSSGAWTKGEYGKRHFVAAPDATNADIFEGVLAGLQSLYLLRAQPYVDPNRIGVAGVSWGGYSTIVISGLVGKDVRAAFVVYGSGHYDAGSTFASALAKLPNDEAWRWLDELDASRYAPGITADFMEASATNDHFFWIPAVEATLDDVRAPKNQVYSPNTNHWIAVPGGCESKKEGVPHNNGWLSMQVPYFAYELKDEGQAFPVVEVGNAVSLPLGTQRVQFRVSSGEGELAASVEYSAPAPLWSDRKWISVPATRQGDSYVAEIPAGVTWFAQVTDSRPVTVSSRMQAMPAGAGADLGAIERTQKD